MPDSEVLKMVLQGGMFALWAIFLVWLLFYGAPSLERTLKQMSADHSATLATTAQKHEEAVRVQAAKNEAAVAALAEAHEAAVAALARECREERQEERQRMGEEREQFLAALSNLTRNGQVR